jgi:PhnB protein
MFKTSIEPWLSVPNAVKAINFYKTAFGAVETYRDEFPDGMVVKLSIDGADFWLSGGLHDTDDTQSQQPDGNSVRMILTVDDPDLIFEKALTLGATQIFPLGEDHGWKLGRLADPFGLHWEIGHPV